MSARPITAALMALAPALAAPALAEQTRGLSAHEHGTGTVEVAAEGAMLRIDLRAPGMDLVGFEHAPRSDAELAAVSEAVMQLLRVSEIAVPAEAAGCRVVEALAHRQGEERGAHAHGEEDHDDDHAEDEAHAGEEGGHSEFRAGYVFACADPGALDSISFPFLERFANARELEARYVTGTGAGAAELTAGAAVLALD